MLGGEKVSVGLQARKTRGWLKPKSGVNPLISFGVDKKGDQRSPPRSQTRDLGHPLFLVGKEF